MPERMRDLRRSSRRNVTVATMMAFVALFVAMAWPAQDGGMTQRAHYALVRSLGNGTPQIDDYKWETGDESYHGGHYFSSKAPGVAFLALPGYVALHAAGLWPDDG